MLCVSHSTVAGQSTSAFIKNRKSLMSTLKGLQETSRYLVDKHGFNEQALKEYIDKIISRFYNPCIDDTTRVGRSPIRK